MLVGAAAVCTVCLYSTPPAGAPALCPQSLIATTMIASNVIMVTSNLRNATAAFTTKLDTLPPYLLLF